MPLARIITLHPEHANALANRLKSQGYAVEIARAEAAGATAADVTVQFDIWPEEFALARAAELAEEHHCDVAVSPALGTGAVPELAQPPSPEIAAPTESPDHREAIQQQQSATQDHWELAEPNQLPPWKSSGSQEEHFAYSPQNPMVDSAVRSTPTEMIATESPDASAPVSENKDRGVVAALAQNTAKALIAGRTLAEEAWESAWHFGREYRQRLEIGRAETRRVRQERLLALEKRKIAAQERNAELEAARQSAALRLQQLLHERGEAAEIAEAKPPQISGISNAAPPNAEPASSSIRARLVNARWIEWFLRRNTPQTEAIVTGVAAVTALFALGLVVASFHPRPALSNAPAQLAPASGVTVQTGGVTVKTAPSPTPAVSHERAPSTPLLPKASPLHRSKADDETDFGSDVSVRHLQPKPLSSGKDARDKRPRTQAKPSTEKVQSQDGVKHISDMDN